MELDITQPWVALIQVILVFVLPQLVGLITDKVSSSKLKTFLLALLTLLGVVGTRLLGVAVDDAWSTYDWNELINLVINWVLVWLLANSAYKGVLKPIGATEKAQESNVIQLFDRPGRHAA
jgi:tetrahydromethanopterin S-methyltransferase subunit C